LLNFDRKTNKTTYKVNDSLM